MSRPRAWVRWGSAAGAVVAAAIVAALLFQALFDWNLLRGAVGRQASAMAGRTIQIRGDLKVHLLSWTPQASAGDVLVGSTPGVGGGDLAQIGQFTIRIKLLPLFFGQVELPLVDFERPQIWALRNADGLSNWRSKTSNSQPVKLPPIQHFVINDGHLRLVDLKRRMVLQADLQSSETLTGGGGGVFHLLGRGSINREPFNLTLTGGPLIEVRANHPYAFNADLRAGQTRIVAQGVLPHPFDFGRLNTALTVSGPDLANLYYLIGVALPNTAAYRLHGDLVRDQRKYTFTHVAGTVGDSDLEGAFQVDHNGERPRLSADLRSRSLDMKDLAAVIGARVRGQSRAPSQPAQAGQRRLLPDAPLDLSRMRSTDAVLKYRADSVMAQPGLPLRGFRLDLSLDHGVMTADPIAFSFPRGALTGEIRIDARPDIPQDTLDLKVTNARLEDFVAKAGAAPPLEGTVEAHAKLTGQGVSAHQVAATANGEVTLVTPHGEVRQSLAELLGIDASRALGLILAKNQSQMGVRCAVADFHADHGVLTARNLVFDSDKVLARGGGTIDLRDESLHLTVSGKPKGFRLIRVMAPITMDGYLSHPTFGIKPGAAPAQAGAAIALGVLFTPLASILPFVDPGLTHDADCVSAIKDAQSLGVPVKPSATTPTNAKAAPAGG